MTDEIAERVLPLFIAYGMEPPDGYEPESCASKEEAWIAGWNDGIRAQDTATREAIAAALDQASDEADEAARKNGRIIGAQGSPQRRVIAKWIREPAAHPFPARAKGDRNE